MFTVEALLGVGEENTVEEVEVKWAGYPSTITTWEPGQHIKSFITSWYSADETRYGTSIPEPTIKYTKEGSPGKVFHFLSFKMQSEIDAEHLPRSVFHLWEAGIPESRCKTRKDKDRRVNDHTQGIFIICKRGGSLSVALIFSIRYSL